MYMVYDAKWLRLHVLNIGCMFKTWTRRHLHTHSPTCPFNMDQTEYLLTLTFVLPLPSLTLFLALFLSLSLSVVLSLLIFYLRFSSLCHFSHPLIVHGSFCLLLVTLSFSLSDTEKVRAGCIYLERLGLHLVSLSFFLMLHPSLCPSASLSISSHRSPLCHPPLLFYSPRCTHPLCTVEAPCSGRQWRQWRQPSVRSDQCFCSLAPLRSQALCCRRSVLVRELVWCCLLRLPLRSPRTRW